MKRMSEQRTALKDWISDSYGYEPSDAEVDYYADLYAPEQEKTPQEKAKIAEAQLWLDNLPTWAELQEAMRKNPNIKNSDDYMHIKMAEIQNSLKQKAADTSDSIDTVKPDDMALKDKAGTQQTTTVTKEDTDNDGDFDKETIVKKEEGKGMADTELSDARCKEIRRKQVEKMKNGWGETDVQKKKKKKTAEADKDDDKDTVDVSGIAKAICSGPGGCSYES